MTSASFLSTRAAMKTPPISTRRQFSSKESLRPQAAAPPVCLTGIYSLFSLIRDAARGEPRDALLDKKLDTLAQKIDMIADKLAQADEREALDARSALRALQDAERDGIEVARYSQIPQFDASILDTFIPRYRRMTQLHFGHIVSNPHAPMAFKEKMGYNMTYNLVPPGHGNALHMHRSIEIFVALDGRWEIAWGTNGQHTVRLQPWDFVAVPARVNHAYKNVEGQTAHNIMTILPGKSWITWAPNVVAEARRNGAECDDNGVLLKYAHLTADTRGLASSSEAVPWKEMGQEEMEPFLHRFSEQRPLELKMGAPNENGEVPSIEMFWKTVQPEASVRLPRKEGIDLLLVVLDGSVLVKMGEGRPVAAAGRLDAVRVPSEALQTAEVVISNPCLTVCTLLVTATQMRDQNDDFFHLC